MQLADWMKANENAVHPKGCGCRLSKGAHLLVAKVATVAVAERVIAIAMCTRLEALAKAQSDIWSPLSSGIVSCHLLEPESAR